MRVTAPRSVRSPRRAAALPALVLLLAAAAPGTADARVAPAPAVTVQRPLVERLRSDPGDVSVAAGPVAAWTLRGRLYVGGDGSARRVAPRLRFALWDVGRTGGGQDVAIGLAGSRRRPAVVSLRDGRRTSLTLPRRVGAVTAAALDGGRVLLGTSGAAGSAGRSALWVGRLGERGDVRGLRRWRYGPRHTVVTRLSAHAGWVTVDTYDDRFDEETEVGDRRVAFVGTTGGRWRSLGEGHASVSSDRYDVSAVGVLPGGRWAVVRTRGEFDSAVYLASVASGRKRELSADEALGRMFELSEDGIALDDRGRLVIVNDAHRADADPDFGGPAVARSIVRTTPLVVPASAATRVAP
jgi:hypothetical protein